MRVTRKQLRQLIKEELCRALIVESKVTAPPVVDTIRSRMSKSRGKGGDSPGDHEGVADMWKMMLNWFKRYEDTPSRRKSIIAAAARLIAPAVGDRGPDGRGWTDRSYLGTVSRPDCRDGRCIPCEQFAGVEDGISSIDSVYDEMSVLNKVLFYVVCAINPKSMSGPHGPRAVDHYGPLLSEIQGLIETYGEDIKEKFPEEQE